MDNINKKILIVEDEKDYLFILQINFKKAGFSVITAKNGEEGLNLIEIEKEKPDLIILDLMMPVMNGFEMAKKMKEKNITIPIIFLTQLKDLDSMSKAIEIIPSDYIIKTDITADKIVAEAKKKLGIS